MQHQEPDFSRKLNVSLRARVTLIVVMTPEEERVVSKIQEVCDTWDPPRQCVTWDSVDGFRLLPGIRISTPSPATRLRRLTISRRPTRMR